MRMVDTLLSIKRATFARDKNYDAWELVGELRGMDINRHVAQNNANHAVAIDQRTTRHAGYEVRQRKQK